MNRYKKLVSDTVLMALGNFSSRVLIFMLLPFYTYILTTEDYGIADLFTTTISMLIPILTLSISEATFRFAFDKEVNQEKNIFCSILIVILSGIIILPITVILSIWNETFSLYGIFFIMLYLSNALHTCLVNYARGTNHIRAFVLASVMYTLLLMIFNILFLAVLKIGIEGYLLSMILAYFGSSMYVFVCIKCWKAFQGENLDIKLCKNMLRFSIPMIFSTTAWWIMNSISKYMIIEFYGIDVSGVYGVAQKIPTIISVLSSIFVQAWQISAISVHGEKGSNEFYTNVYKVYEVGLFVAAACIIFLTKPMASILFQKDYYDAYVYVPILVLSCVFSCLASFLQSPFVAEKKSGVLLCSTLVGALVSVVTSYGLLMYIGTIGAAYATMIGFLATWIIRIITSRKFVKFDLKWYKTICSMILLLIEAIVISIDIPLGMLYCVIVIIIIVILHIDTIKLVLGGALNMIKKS